MNIFIMFTLSYENIISQKIQNIQFFKMGFHV